jgi:hypothetical protein
MGWVKRDKLWNEYPIGTVARQSWTGMRWTKTARGWMADGGSTFPVPGDANEVWVSSVSAAITGSDRGGFR